MSLLSQLKFSFLPRTKGSQQVKKIRITLLKAKGYAHSNCFALSNFQHVSYCKVREALENSHYLIAMFVLLLSDLMQQSSAGTLLRSISVLKDF